MYLYKAVQQVLLVMLYSQFKSILSLPVIPSSYTGPVYMITFVCLSVCYGRSVETTWPRGTLCHTSPLSTHDLEECLNLLFWFQCLTVVMIMCLDSAEHSLGHSYMIHWLPSSASPLWDCPLQLSHYFTFSPQSSLFDSHELACTLLMVQFLPVL